ncbi:MAG: hypothetical protein IT452_14655 [Planctomycetia bacterium]|nr:hypothetical protein [Planctomycetia bacterium]
MHVKKTPDGRFAIIHGARQIALQKAQYEDIFYALPLDSGTLFRLVNDTVLTSDPLRVEFRTMVTEAGGSEKAMAELQESAKTVEPG